MEKFLELLSKTGPLSESFIHALKERAVWSSFPRDHILLEASQVSSTMYFLQKGLAMSYQYINNRKHIGDLYNEGTMILSSKSFFEQLPSKESIQLLGSCEVYMISYESMMWLLENYKEAISLYLMTMTSYLENHKDRIHDLQLLNAVERYEKLRIKFPSVFKSVPLEQIATYLGIAPQSLSRIRRESDDY